MKEENLKFEFTKKSVNISICSMRKNSDDLKNALESVVIPMFCNATISKLDDGFLLKNL